MPNGGQLLDNRQMNTRWKPHVTVAAIIERGGRYLLVEEHTHLGLQLNNPAGHMEAGESPEQACAREVLEETAHTFEPTGLVGVYLSRVQHPRTHEDITYVRMAFGGVLGPVQANRPLDTGVVRTLWLTLDEVRASQARHRSPVVLRCIEDHAARALLPLSAIHTDPSVGQMGQARPATATSTLPS